jgi:hypothetical protein
LGPAKKSGFRRGAIAHDDSVLGKKLAKALSNDGVRQNACRRRVGRPRLTHGGLSRGADRLGEIAKRNPYIVIHGRHRRHLAARGDFDDRLALIGEGRDGKERAHEDELLIFLQEGDRVLGEIRNLFDGNTALSPCEAGCSSLCQQVSPVFSAMRPASSKLSPKSVWLPSAIAVFLPLVRSAMTSWMVSGETLGVSIGAAGIGGAAAGSQWQLVGATTVQIFPEPIRE